MPQAFGAQILHSQGGLFEAPSWKYRETMLQRRNAAGLWAEQETGSVAEETLLKNSFVSPWLQQKWMDLTSQQGYLAHHVASESFILQDHQKHLHIYK